MDIFQWIILFLGQNASDLAVHNQSLNVNNNLFIPYLIISLLLKRSSYMAAFFMSCMLFEMEFFNGVYEFNLYLLTFAFYSYVIVNCKTNKSIAACGIILFLSITFAIDSALYGEHGYYGARETIIYNNIEYLSLYAHIIFIYTLIPFRRIEGYLRSCVASLLHMSRNSAYFVVL